MKVLHLTKTSSGGAGVAAVRTVAALRSTGVEAELWTEGSPGCGRAGGTLRRWLLDKWDSVPHRAYLRSRRFASWSNNWRRTKLADAINAARPDVVHLHWVAQGFLSLDELPRIDAPIVWTMHDLWPFTGGCHYPGACRRFEISCGACPQLGSTRAGDLSARNHASKSRYLGRVARWITPSHWLGGLAGRSGLIPSDRLRVIPYAFDLARWPNGGSRAEARRALGVAEGALVFVAGSMDLREPRKGAFLLPAALDAVAAQTERPVVALLFGSGRVAAGHRRWTAHYVGRKRTPAELAELYYAADVALMPSLQDNLPWFAIEAQASGCPVVGFDSGGIAEIVSGGETGVLTSTMSAAALAEAATHWLRLGTDREIVSRACRERVRSRYDPAAHAVAHVREYEAVRAARG